MGLANNFKQSAFSNLKISKTQDIIEAAVAGLLPDRIMITVYPQRWTDSFLPWIKELVWQNIKNIGKYLLLKSRRLND